MGPADRRGELFALAVGLVPFLVLVALHWNVGPPAGAGDYAQYLLHAKALAEGRAYRDVGYIFTHYNPYVGPPAYPPGLPLTLAPLLAIAGPSPLVLRLVMVLSACAFLLLAGRYFAARYGIWMGVGVVLISGVALEAGNASTLVMSDLGFCALVWGAIVLADGAGRWRASRIVLVTAVGLGAMAYRYAGAALAPALVLYALTRRDDRIRVALPALVWMGLMALAAAALPIPGVFGNGDMTLGHWFSGSTFRLTFYRLGVFGAHLYPFDWNRANDAYHVVSVAVMFIGLGDWVRRWARSFLASFAVTYLAMLLVVVVIDGRYLWPLYPVFAFGLLNGIRVLAARLPALRPPARAVATAITAAALISLAAAITTARAPRPIALADDLAVRDLFAHLRSLRLRAPIRVAFVNPRVLTWETGVPAMGLFFAPPDSVAAELRNQRITHVVIGTPAPLAGRDRAFLNAVAARPGEFRAEFQAGRYVVYERRTVP